MSSASPTTFLFCVVVVPMFVLMSDMFAFCGRREVCTVIVEENLERGV